MMAAMRMVRSVGVVLVVGLVSTGAWGNFVSLDFIAHCNRTLQSIDGGYPVGNVTLGGVPFSIPASGNNVWHTQYLSGGNPRSVSIDVNQYAVDKVHTIINTWWGTANPGEAWIEFYAAGDAAGSPSHTVYLDGNVEIRDYNQSAYTNYIQGGDSDGDGVTVVNVYPGNHRLDKQQIDLPASFNNTTLERMVVVDDGGYGYQRVFLAGATAELIPEPAALGFLALGSAILLRRR